MQIFRMMPQTTESRRRVTVIILALATVLLLAVAIVVAIRLAQNAAPGDSSAASVTECVQSNQCTLANFCRGYAGVVVGSRGNCPTGNITCTCYTPTNVGPGGTCKPNETIEDVCTGTGFCCTCGTGNKCLDTSVANDCNAYCNAIDNPGGSTGSSSTSSTGGSTGGTPTGCPGNQPVTWCSTFTCPNGDTNGDGQCTLLDTGATENRQAGSSCANPFSCGQVDFYYGDIGNFNNFCYYTFINLINCTGGSASSSVPVSTPSSSATSTPASTPSSVASSAVSSTPFAYQCVDLARESGTGAISDGESVLYSLTYTAPSAAELPFPINQIKLLVSASNTVASGVGRDVNAQGSLLVSPLPNVSFANGQVTYFFAWQATMVGGGVVSNGTYNVRVLTGGTEASLLASPAACTESIQLLASEEVEPAFTVVKSATVTMLQNGGAQVNYTITATNISAVSGTLDFVRDTLPTGLDGTTHVTNVSPSGTVTATQITWAGPISFTPGQSRQYTFRLNLSAAEVAARTSTGLLNNVTIQFDTPSQPDNTVSFDLFTPLTNLPDTGLFDDNTFLILLGLLLIIGGVLANRYGQVLNWLGFDTVAPKRDATSGVVRKIVADMDLKAPDLTQLRDQFIADPSERYEAKVARSREKKIKRK